MKSSQEGKQGEGGLFFSVEESTKFKALIFRSDRSLLEQNWIKKTSK